ncbi:MAG: branched-chain amino acid ABC transporter permease [bacterium]
MEGQLAINAALAGTHYGLIALSFALVSRTARFVHVAHGAVYTLGAYATLSLIGTGIGVVPSAMAGVVTGGVAGCTMELTVFRPLRRRGASPESLLLASFGLLVVLQNVAALTWGNARRVFSIRAAEPGAAFLGGHVTVTQLAAVGISLVLAVGLVLWSRRSFAGLVLRAVGDDPELSLVRGIRTESAILLAFAVASGAMALAGILQAMETGLTPLMGFRALLVAFVGALLGGLDSDGRAYLGGLAIGVLEQVAALYLPGQWYESVILALLVVVVVTRGHRLIGERGR